MRLEETCPKCSSPLYSERDSEVGEYKKCYICSAEYFPQVPQKEMPQRKMPELVATVISIKQNHPYATLAQIAGQLGGRVTRQRVHQILKEWWAGDSVT